MSKQSLLVFDVAQQIFESGAELSSAKGPRLAGSENWSVRHHRLQGGLSEGVDVIEINNGTLSVSVLPTRGMGIWKGRCQGIPLGWLSPVGLPVHPSFVELNDRGGLGWLNGFNELLCRCGLAFNGPPGEDLVRDDSGKERSRTPITLHGRIANLPAHRVEIEVDPSGQGLLAVTGIVDETSMFGPCLRLSSRLETVAGSRQFRVLDTVTNLGGQPAELELLYHTNVGRPVLEAGAQLVAPVLEVTPRDGRAAEDQGHWNTFAEPRAGYSEQVYFLKLAADQSRETEVLLRNNAGDRGLSVRFSLGQLPYFTLWKNTAAEADGYVMGLEPGTNLPNFKSVEREQGRVISLPPGGEYKTRLDLEVHPTAEAVRAVEQRIVQLKAPMTKHQ